MSRKEIKIIMDIVKAFGYTVRKHREIMPLTQAQLAEKSNLSVRHISDIENGKVNPKLDTVVQLCNICKINISDLLLSEE